MRLFYTVTGIALMGFLTSTSALAWMLHMHKTIKPGDTVTITCANPATDTNVTQCNSGELVVSPGYCSSDGN